LLTGEIDVVVIIRGLGGLLAGALLHEAAINDVRIIEASSDFVHPWWLNRYLSAQCDIESYCCLPR